MTQHEYVFVAISIILGLAITRLLHTVGMLIRAHRDVTFHWSTSLWGLCVLCYCLQFWWVGWALREIDDWSFLDFAVLNAGSICVYGAAEMALPVPEGQRTPDFLAHSESLGRLSALSLLLYFAIGPYVNITMFGHGFLPSVAVPLVGAALMLLVIFLPTSFRTVSVLFSAYTALVLFLTT